MAIDMYPAEVEVLYRSLRFILCGSLFHNFAQRLTKMACVLHGIHARRLDKKYLTMWWLNITDLRCHIVDCIRGDLYCVLVQD